MNEPADSDPFKLDPEWQALVGRIVKMMETGVVSSAELPVGPASAVGIERYARAVCDANPQTDLGIMYGLISVATCTAAQGAYVLKAPIAGGGWLIVPAIQYFIGIAPSGWRKSTALDVARKPLKRAIEHGESLRRKDLPRMRDWAERDGSAVLPVGRASDAKQYAKVYNGGLCHVTLVKDPTVEGTRDMLVNNGGCAAVFAGEADVFTNVNKYAPDQAGSLTFILDGWSQDDISTMRVGRGMLRMNEAALYMAVLFQTDVFASVTNGGMYGTGDSYQDRGMFGRFLVVEAEKTGGWQEAAAAYPDGMEWPPGNDADGMTDEFGELTLLGLALNNYREALMHLVMESNDYRLHKALRHSWLQASAEYGNDLQVPEVDQKPRTELVLDSAALNEYARVQRAYAALEHRLGEMDPDIQSLWGPLVSRFVQHVLREALTVTLASGKRVVTAEIIRDSALRITPWRWGLWSRALTKRINQRVEGVIAASFAENSREADLDPESKMRRVLVRMAQEDSNRMEGGWTAEEIVRRAVATIPKANQKGIAPRLRLALDALERDVDSGVSKVPSGTEHRYVISKVTVENHRRP